MDGVSAIAENVRLRVLAENPAEPGDYINSDGLLICGSCHTPRREMLNLNGTLQEYPVICQCRKLKDEEAKKAEILQENNLKTTKLKLESQMDPKYKNATFETIEVTQENAKLISMCKKYVQQFDRLYKANQGLLFYGPVGTGKTHLAACIANELMENLHSVQSTSMIKILQQVRSMRNDSDEYSTIAKTNSAKMLIIDDLGAERSTDYGLEVVYNIIDSRYRSGKPMIVSTNLTIEEMKNCNDIRLARIYDRIFEVCYPVEFKGISLRRKAAVQRFDHMKQLLEGD